MSPPVDLTAHAEDFTADPYPFYAALREQGPVHWVRTPYTGDVWLVVGYAEARAALADPRLRKDWQSVLAGSQDYPLSANMLDSDPPVHTRLRKLVAREFTARRVEAMRPRVERVTADLLAALPEHGTADLIEEFAFPLPMTVICDLLGVPDLDRARFRRWSQAVVGGAAGAEEEGDAASAMHAYLSDLIEDKRCAGPADDLLSALIRTRHEDGDRLSAGELIGMAFLLLVAGHETTVNLIGNGLLALFRHPEQLAALRADLSLLDGAVEEMLRYDGPVETATWRFTPAPVEIGGTVIPPHQVVGVVLAAADRDPGRYPQADTFDIRRPPGGHLAFGHGIHYCLGAPLARLEAKVAFAALLTRFPDLSLAVPPRDLRWRPGPLMRGVHTLPVSF
ncbi:cytochrome P450 family protein [Actinacidiphila acididurans]|uniref:Cytochrome P450 n=1 Tax=Actinacidiphila acididurans TaxID=2784346 RepID=A0ABS2TUJ4_9ACTN|nr:cytochrome P450 [Actinacidiphila acididurans]MBM9507003.1 cytochrome P450 [Actinacidiphila acididurans]